MRVTSFHFSHVSPRENERPPRKERWKAGWARRRLLQDGDETGREHVTRIAFVFFCVMKIIHHLFVAVVLCLAFLLLLHLLHLLCLFAGIYNLKYFLLLHLSLLLLIFLFFFLFQLVPHFLLSCSSTFSSLPSSSVDSFQVFPMPPTDVTTRQLTHDPCQYRRCCCYLSQAAVVVDPSVLNNTSRQRMQLYG